MKARPKRERARALHSGRGLSPADMGIRITERIVADGNPANSGATVHVLRIRLPHISIIDGPRP